MKRLRYSSNDFSRISGSLGDLSIITLVILVFAQVAVRPIQGQIVFATPLPSEAPSNAPTPTSQGAGGLLPRVTPQPTILLPEPTQLPRVTPQPTILLPEPTQFPTPRPARPTPAPTLAKPPTVPPTMAPVVPTNPPTRATKPPTIPPVIETKPPRPTQRPLLLPTKPPTVPPKVVTPSPTNPPVVATEPPVVKTDPPVVKTAPPVVKTDPPVVPTEFPVVPTEPPVKATDPPAAATDPPVAETKPSPSDATDETSPTIAPTGTVPDATAPPVGSQTPLIEGIQPRLRMILTGLEEAMSESTTETWKQITAEYIQEFFAERHPDLGINSVSASFMIEDQLIVERDDFLLVIFYDQNSAYRSSTEGVTPLTLALAPFANEEDRRAYIDKLKGAGDAYFIGLTEVNVEERDDVMGDQATERGGLATGAIAGIVAGGGGAILLFALILFFRSKANENDPAYATTDKPPPAQLDVEGGKGEEVSTLAEPNQAKDKTPASGASVGGTGDQSVATVDYDYSKAYGGGGDTSVSSAGGTFGSNTHAQSAAEATGATTGSLETSFSDQQRGQSKNVKEELIDIYAPPGKLGVVIDTPDDGAPVVHAVKDSSVIADKLQVGDKLVAVDDEDVRSMTAIKVSKLISRKSTNPTRKLSIIRTVAVKE